MTSFLKTRSLFVAAIASLALISCNDINPDLFPRKEKPVNPQQGVYYSVFVRSFADSNGDGIGDLNGITAKLDYIEKLGVRGIWLLPIYPSHSYHGYDVDDYYNVNAEYGTLSDFENLCVQAAKRGIAVILDMPFNHSSVHNQWFIESTNERSTKRDWYRWANPEANPEINFEASIWQHKVWNERGADYYSGLYYGGMPDFNHDNPALRAEFKKILKFWLEKGASGFRFDAAHQLYNTLKMPYGTTGSQEKTIEFWKEMCGFVTTVKPDAFMVGEVWDTAGTRAEYMRGMPSTFHFDLGTKIVNAIKNGNGSNNAIATALQADYAAYAEKNPNYIDAPFLSNHDQNRTPLQFRNNADCVKLAASMYLFLPGISFVYYGEEIGMNGAKPDEQIRTPMIWSKNGSDSMQTKWIESKYNDKTLSVAQQRKNRHSILNYYRKAIKFRNKNQEVFSGKFQVHATGNEAITSWSLKTEERRFYIFFNLSDTEQTIRRPYKTENHKLVFEGNSGALLTKTNITLPAKTAVVLGN